MGTLAGFQSQQQSPLLKSPLQPLAEVSTLITVLTLHHRNCCNAGAVGALAGFQSLQASSEARLLQLVADRTAAILEPARHLNWLPDQPPRTALGHSAHIQDLLPFLKVSHTAILCSLAVPMLPCLWCLGFT